MPNNPNIPNSNETIDDILERMDELLDKATGVPFTNKKGLVDIEQLREYIDSIRYNLPTEIKKAKQMVADRFDIIKGANASAEDIIKNAETRASKLVSEEEIVKQATAAAKEITSKARQMDLEIKKAMVDKLDGILSETEASINKSLSEIKAMRNAIRTASQRASSGQSQSKE